MAENLFAGFWARLLAALIDTGILSALSYCTFTLIEFFPFDGAELYRELIMWLSAAALWAAYQGWMETTKLQATFGKLLVGAYVTDLNGQRLPFSTAAIRCWPMYILYIVAGFEILTRGLLSVELDTTFTSILLPIPVIACLYIFLSPKNQGLHDIWSGTLVLRKPTKSLPEKREL